MTKHQYPLVICYIAIENGPVEIVDLPMKNGGSFHSYVSLPEGKLLTDHILAQLMTRLVLIELVEPEQVQAPGRSPESCRGSCIKL